MIIKVIGRKEDLDKKVNTHYLLSNGNIYTREETIDMWRRRLLPGYHVRNRNGVEELCNTPHTKESDNIDNQPLI